MHQRKEQQPNGLAIPMVPNEASLPMIRKVGISFVVALMSMMLQMINAKSHRTWSKVWQVRHDRDEPVQVFVSKDEIVNGVVNNDIICVVGEGTHEVGQEQA